MGRENGEEIVIQSSIALLQERFRQLEREKEMRQGRELLRRLSASERFYYGTTAPQCKEPISSKVLFQSEAVITPPPHKQPPCQVSLSLWPTTSQMKKQSSFMRSWPNYHKPNPLMTTITPPPPIKHKDSDSHDVDTSLHL